VSKGLPWVWRAGGGPKVQERKGWKWDSASWPKGFGGFRGIDGLGFSPPESTRTLQTTLHKKKGEHNYGVMIREAGRTPGE